jgi:formate dehydrogenase subunit gamma
MTLIASMIRTVAAGALLLLALTGFALAQGSSSVRPPDNAVGKGGPNVVQPDKPSNYDGEMWRKVRGGLEGQVSIPDKKAGVLVQSGGEVWRNVRNGPLIIYSAWAMAGVLALLAGFYLARGSIRVEHGLAGWTIERFTDIERMGHWLMAVSFVILGLTGLNVVYGKYTLLPVLGPTLFAAISQAGKWLHNYVAFAFMAGLLLSFINWVSNNIPNKHDVKWLLMGGGMFARGAHPPARKFNAGQKILFWLIMLTGVSISLSGLSMMFPFQTSLFSKTFGWLNVLGLGLPAIASPVQEMQFATLWHSIMAIFMICVIFGHIYIGTIGMEGAYDAMGSGRVDINWAKEHHNIWAEEELAKLQNTPAAGSTPRGPGGPVMPLPAE